MFQSFTFSSSAEGYFQMEREPLKNLTCCEQAFVKSLARKRKKDTYILKKKTYSKGLSELGSGLLQELVPGLPSFFPFAISGIPSPP